MATIPMRSGFTLCPAGVHIFRIYAVDYKQDFGKLEVKMVNAQGITHTERFSLIGQNGQPNEGACNAFSYFAKTALNDFTRTEIDHTELVGRYIKAEVTHTDLPSTKDPTKTVTFANLGDKAVADGFDTTPVPRALTLGTEADKPKETASTPTAAAPAQSGTGSLDLAKLLN